MSDQHLVVAFAGRSGAGKSTLAEHLATLTQARRAAFGDYLRALNNSLSQDADISALQIKGHDLVSADPAEFVNGFLKWAGGLAGLGVIDGVRHVAVAEELHRTFATNNIRMILVYVEAGVELRAERRTRGRLDAMQAIDAHPVEQDIENVAQIADIRVSGMSDPVEVLAEIEQYQLG